MPRRSRSDNAKRALRRAWSRLPAARRELPVRRIKPTLFLYLKELLTKHKNAVAEHLERNFDDFFSEYRNLLPSQNYVACRQLLRLLGELLGDRCNFKITTRLIVDVDLLKVRPLRALPASSSPCPLLPSCAGRHERSARPQPQHTVRSVPHLQNIRRQPQQAPGDDLPYSSTPRAALHRFKRNLTCCRAATPNTCCRCSTFSAATASGCLSSCQNSTRTTTTSRYAIRLKHAALMLPSHLPSPHRVSLWRIASTSCRKYSSCRLLLPSKIRNSAHTQSL